MREATFLIPHVPGSDGEEAHKWVERQLEHHFSGWSAIDRVRGAWRDKTGKVHRDVSTRYTVAYPVDDWLSAEKHMEVIVLIARTAGRQINQQSVYVRDHAGKVEIVTC